MYSKKGTALLSRRWERLLDEACDQLDDPLGCGDSRLAIDLDSQTDSNALWTMKFIAKTH